MDPEIKTQLVRRLTELLGGGWTLEPVRYDVNSATTAGLYRVRFGPERSAVFVKVLSSFRVWPMTPHLSEDFRELATAEDFWRYEADVYLDGLTYSLPTGLRLPKLYCVDELDRDHVILLLEDVELSSSGWDQDRYGRAAELLGRLSARLTRNDALPAAADRVPDG